MSDQNPDNLHDNAIAYFFIGIVLAGLIWLLWYFKHAEIRDMVRWIRYAEMWVLHWFVPQDFQVAFNGQNVSWHEGFSTTADWSKQQLTNQHLGLFTQMTMPLMRYAFAAVCAAGAIVAYTKGPKTHNRQNLGLEGLIKYQSQNFPSITPFIKFNPSKQPPRPPGTPVPAELPLFAEALGPEEWIAYHSIPVPDGTVDRKAAAKAFQAQLIGRWKGVKALKPYQQVMFAAFCLKASRKRDQGDAMLGRLATCWDHEAGLDLKKDKSLLSEAHKVLRTKKLAEKTITEANHHAFVTTALLRALQYAREEGGVLAPAQFVWLRGHDRTLWYPMNNLGRQSYHMEALGAMSHFKAERLTRRPIPSPKVDHAVDTITDYMNSMDARPIPALDYKGSNKKAIKKAV